MMLHLLYVPRSSSRFSLILPRYVVGGRGQLSRVCSRVVGTFACQANGGRRRRLRAGVAGGDSDQGPPTGAEKRKGSFVPGKCRRQALHIAVSAV